MEKNCIFCESPIYPDAISYKIGKHFICYRCASTQTIRSLGNLLHDELRVGPNVVDVTDSSLAGQTDSSYEDDEAANSITCAEDMYEYEAKRLSKEDYHSEYFDDFDALTYWTETHPDSIE